MRLSVAPADLRETARAMPMKAGIRPQTDSFHAFGPIRAHGATLLRCPQVKRVSWVGAPQPQPGLSARHLGAAGPRPFAFGCAKGVELPCVAKNRNGLSRSGRLGFEAGSGCESGRKPRAAQNSFFWTERRVSPPQKKSGRLDRRAVWGRRPGAAIAEEIFRKSAKNA